MSLSLLEIRTRVRSCIKRESTSLSDSTVDSYINQSQRGIARLHTFSEMYKTEETVTVASQKHYTYPERMKNIFSIRLIDNGSSRKLIRVDSRRFDDLVPYPENLSEARSTHYIDFGTYFEVYPIPDAIYSLYMRISKFPKALTADSDESDLDEKDDIIIAGANGYGMEELRELDDATYWFKRFRELLNEAIKGDHTPGDWTSGAAPFRLGTFPIGRLDTNPFSGLGNSL